MNNKKGMSLVSVIVTILILIFITGITVFTGIDSANKSRIKAANDRLEIIYQALIAYEEELGFLDTVPKRSLSKQDYITMKLDEYAVNFDETPKVYIEKKIGTIATPNLDGVDSDSDGVTDYEEYITSTNDQNRTYKLSTTTATDGGTECTYTKTYKISQSVYSLSNLFDYSAGVNRPIVSSKMKAVVYNSNNEKKYVEDVYTEKWYSYNKNSPKWATIELDGIEFVWIPRYAYKIQQFYLNTNMTDIPASAIDILFLKENSNTLSSNEPIPDGYKVHPAFKFGDVELSGIWVEKEPVVINNLGTNISNVFESVMQNSYYDLTVTEENVRTDIHLAKNIERGAATYLLYSTGNNSVEKIEDLQLPNLFYDSEIVAAYLNDSTSTALNTNGSNLTIVNNKYVDKYNSDAALNPYDANIDKYGDAIIETSSSLANTPNTYSAWNNSISNFPTPESPFIIRNGLFGYDSSTGDNNSELCRRAIAIYED